MPGSQVWADPLFYFLYYFFKKKRQFKYRDNSVLNPVKFICIWLDSCLIDQARAVVVYPVWLTRCGLCCFESCLFDQGCGLLLTWILSVWPAVGCVVVVIPVCLTRCGLCSSSSCCSVWVCPPCLVIWRASSRPFMTSNWYPSGCPMSSSQVKAKKGNDQIFRIFQHCQCVTKHCYFGNYLNAVFCFLCLALPPSLPTFFPSSNNLPGIVPGGSDILSGFRELLVGGL